MRRFLVAFVLLGAGVAFGQAVEPTNPQCANEAVFGPLAQYIRFGIPTGGPTPDSVECVVGGNSYVIVAGTVIEALATMSGSPYVDGYFSGTTGDCSGVGAWSGSSVVFCSEKGIMAGFNTKPAFYFLVRPGGDQGYYRHSEGSGICNFRPSDSCAAHQSAVSGAIDSVRWFDDAFRSPFGEGQWFRTPFLSRWAVVLSTGGWLSCGEWGFCYEPEDPEEPGPGEGGGDPGGPADEVTRCGILDIPCNLRKLFIPSEGWAEEFAGVSTWGASKFPFGIVQWFQQEECAHASFGCGPGQYFLAVPLVGRVVVGHQEVELGGWTLFASHEDGLDAVAAPMRPISAWWIAEPFGGRKLLFYGFVTAFYIGIFRRFS